MNGNTSLKKNMWLVLSLLHISRELTQDQTHTDLGGIFGWFLQRYELQREYGWWISDESADRGCTFLKILVLKISHSHWLTAAKTLQWTNMSDVFRRVSEKPSLPGLLICCTFSLLVKLYVCLHVRMFKDVYSLRASDVWMDVCAVPQRYSFGHRYELCMQQTEILKIYFFLSANYGVERRNRGVWVPPWWERVNLFPPVQANANQQLSLRFRTRGFLPRLILHSPYAWHAASFGSVRAAPSKNGWKRGDCLKRFNFEETM